MSDLLGFVLARLDEDERQARYVLSRDYVSYLATGEESSSGVIDTGAPGLEGLIPVGDSTLSRFIVTRDPARVLAEARTKRRIVTRALEFCVLDIAERYSDHSDYDPQ